MENKNNNNNNLVIILMGIIIVILAVLCVLFATNTITFNKQVPNNSTENNVEVEENFDEILKNLVINNLRQLVWSDYGNYGCSYNEDKTYYEHGVFAATQIGYYRCDDIKTIEEYISNVKDKLIKDGNYSTNYIETYIDELITWVNKENHPDLKCKTDVCEYKDKVYFTPYFKPIFDSFNVERQKFNNIRYSTNKNENGIVDGTFILTWNNGHYHSEENNNIMYFHEKYNIKLVKENNTWKIDNVTFIKDSADNDESPEDI